MANYGWTGPGKTREISHDRMDAPKITEPARAGVDDKVLLQKCTVEGCGRQFRKAMIAARHFNSTHSDLHEDKNTWRQYIEEVVDG